MNKSILNYSIFSTIRNSKVCKPVAVLIAIQLLFGNVLGTKLYALTTGPSQPEASEFQPASIDNLVDPFTGDFSYNIPVMEIGGYPINLSYAAGITPDQEATWVGLGWNLNTGAITRNMRGLPDDFNGDEVVKETNIKDNKTYGVNVGLGGEAFGFDISKKLGLNFSFGMAVTYNNYNGYNISQSFTPSIGAAENAKGPFNFSLGLTSSSSDGLTISPNLSYSKKINEGKVNEVRGGLGIGLSMNSRTGLGNLSLSGSYTASNKKTLNEKTAYAKQDSKTASAGANLSFSSPSFVPQNQNAFENSAVTFNGMLGLAMVGLDADLKVGGFYSQQSLKDRKQSCKAYGYLYSENGQGSENGLQDFNREKDASFSPKTTKNLAITNFTHDVYQIQAQGLGGSFRPFRNDGTYIHDQSVNSPNNSGSISIELASAQVLDGGINLGYTNISSKSGMWDKHNSAKNSMPYKSRNFNDRSEKVHFRMAGEPTVDSDLNYYNALGADNAVRFKLDGLRAENKFITQDNNVIPFNKNLNRQNRQNIVSSVQYYTVREVIATSPYYKRYLPQNNNGGINYSIAKSHHIAKIVIVKPDGSRYVFGLPAYNTKQVEITMAVGKNKDENAAYPFSVNSSNNTIQYTDETNSINNKNGLDNRYDKTELPAYVHTWYLTEVLSADYVDVTGDGPSEDDLGNYTVFEYGNYNSANNVATPDVPNYKWRTPTTSNMSATYNKNLLTDEYDDSANLLYGEKQIWYLHTISSKTQVCVFNFIDREDGLGVSGINGGINSSARQKAINTIALYSKEDWLLNGTGAIPIKVAHFNYNYSLCKGAPNNVNSNSGKLTLKSVYFTFDKSGRAKFSPYKFDYKENIPENNPNYSTLTNDRWGNYKNLPTNISLPSNADYPYAEQNKTIQDKAAQVWCLQEIRLPSGGIIKVEYESDDYAYVQDREACHMFKVVGVRQASNGLPDYNLSPSSTIYNHNGSGNNDQSGNLYLYFKLDNTITENDHTVASNIIREKYFTTNSNNTEGPLQHLYFRFLINVDDATNTKEYVSGYADVNDNEIHAIGSNGNWTHGAIKIHNVDLDDGGQNNENPISKTAWQFSRLQTPRNAFHQDDPSASGIQQILEGMASSNFLNTIIQMFQGVNRRLRNEGFGTQFDTNKSWIRLLDPDGSKLGGGHRVKRILISDNWAELTDNNETEFTYGQEYSYNLDNRKSSGVAAWEPPMGADENPFKTPIFMSKKVLMAPNEDFYIEKPLGDSFFPGASVGYSMVTIKNIGRANVTVNATGKIVKKFKTAKDFPTKVKSTDLTYERNRTGIGINLLIANLSSDKVAATQGYTIINNDMHGKQEEETVYDESGTVISSTKYQYKMKDGDLDNVVDVINRDGSVTKRMVGVDYDFIADMRQSKTTTNGGTAEINAAFFMLGIIPAVIPTMLPTYTREKTEFRSATTTKVIFRTGILEKTTVTDKGAIVTTQNMAYDAETGQVLLTKVNNEYNKERYAITIPAHWAYDRMGFAADNWGYTFKLTSTDINANTKEIEQGADCYDMLVPGDEVYITSERKIIFVNTPLTQNSHRLWVAENESGEKFLIDKDGNIHLFDFNSVNTYYLKIFRSGRKNIPSASIGSLEVASNPIASGRLSFSNVRILNTSAQEFSENWRTRLVRDYVKEYSSVTCGANSNGNTLLMLLNKLIDQNKLVTATGPVSEIPSPTSLSYPTNYYNLNGLVPTGAACEYTYTGIANGYTPPWGSNIELNNNAWLEMSIKAKNGNCPTCTELYLISLEDQSNFQKEDFSQIVSLSSVITVENYLQITGISPYTYLYNNPQNILITTATLNDGSEKDFILYSGCRNFNIASNCCDIVETYSCVLDTPNVVNPYLQGLLGNWRPLKSYTYLTDREPNTINTNPAIDRSIAGYYSFGSEGYYWNSPPPNSNGFWYPISNLGKWKWTSEITNYNPAGGEVENVNPLGIYSSAVYGYKETLPIIVAQNAKYKEIGYDGFEDYYNNSNTQITCIKEHFKLPKDYWEYISIEEAHTGKKSLKTNQEVTYSYKLSPSQTRRVTSQVPYRLGYNDLLPTFSPDNSGNKKYVLSFWVKQQGYQSTTNSYSNVGATIKLDGINIGLANPKKSKVIDGWQQLEYEFIIPQQSNNSIIEFVFNPQGQFYYIDDVRVHPFDATAKSFVYDSRNLRFMAELDENNYATYYEYDNEGALIRVKKETERGIITLKENRNNSAKTNP